MGIERIIGFYNQRGPFTQERAYFSGLQYKLKAESKFSLMTWKPSLLNKKIEDQGNFIEPFDTITPRMHIMQIFE